MTPTVRNWAGNVVFSPGSVRAPRTLTRLQELVARADHVRVRGAGHSFTALTATPGLLLRLGRLPRSVEVDATEMTAWVSAGTKLGELAPLLHEQGFALRTLPSLPHVSVAGACATGTHGSGDDNEVLASAVSAVRLVRADGRLTTLTRDSADFPGVAVSLGALGVLTHVRLDLVPTYEVEQHVYEELSWPSLLENHREIFGCAHSVSVFTDWTRPSAVWVKRRADGPPVDLGWTGARRAVRPRHPVPHLSAENCTEQLGIPGPWHERLPHFRTGFTPSVGVELQSEYFLPLDHAQDVLRALGDLAPVMSPVLQVSEVRTVRGDALWLSPSSRRPSLVVHFTWVLDVDAVTRVLPEVERALAPWSPRPHWGKLFATPPQVLRTRYDHWSDFQRLRRELDPTGKFGNPLVESYFPGGD
ncbi:FAD-binding protein [Streptoalloteichus hindustanus]|uniref:Xylitol oxidase n=1 Tax=Streptoalloteichus hindustanus TaxID=2017 RepID=A0A1M5IAX8_STRHI|nr:FAD-binding protein [Streptoalloteichus hindustanus]SHG25411.1 xylitol oxidase [Streptoalloteichus hindustanus]